MKHWLTAIALVVGVVATSPLLAQRRFGEGFFGDSGPPEPPAIRRSGAGQTARARPGKPKYKPAVTLAALAQEQPTAQDQSVKKPVEEDAIVDMPIVDMPISGMPIEALDMPIAAGCNQSAGFGFPNGRAQIEYLMWWPRGMQVPPLVTSGNLASAGVLGAPGTQTLVGGKMLNEMFSGARLNLGLWWDPGYEIAWEADGFFIGEVTDTRTFRPDMSGGSVLARPFFNVLTSQQNPNGREDAELVAYPGLLSGQVTVAASSELYGVGIHGIRRFCQSSGCSPALLRCGGVPVRRDVCGFVGWRYMRLSESLQINEDLTSLLPAPDNGRFLIEDRFGTGNTFNGADFGAIWSGRRGRFSMDMLMRLAVGATHQNVRIAGMTTVRGSSEPTNNFENATGGLYAQRTNIGDYSRSRFAMIPELGVTLGCDLTPRWRFTIGYTLLYWSSVVRPGEQIDRDVNPNLLPPEVTPMTGLERPVFSFVESDLLINGLNLGLQRTW